MGALSLKKITGSEGLDLGGKNAGLASLAAGMFLPGLTGLSALESGLAVGGAMGLATGSLQKGIMAGLGAYGGAGLAGGLMQSGIDQAARSAAASGGIDEISNAVSQAKSSPFSTMASGVTNLGEETGRNAFMSSVGGGKGLAQYGLAATLPIMAGAGVPTTTGLPTTGQYPGYIRPFSYDPRTQGLTPFAPVPTSRLYAEGGAVEPSDDGYVHAFGGGWMLPDVADTVQQAAQTAAPPPQAQPQPQQPAFRDPAAQAAIQQQLIQEYQQRAAQQQAAQQAQQQAITAPFQQPTTAAQGALSQALAYTPTATPFTPTPMTGDSAAAYNYLMGKSAYPYVTQDKEVFRPYTELVASRIFNPPMIQAPASSGTNQTQTQTETQTGGTNPAVIGAGLAGAATLLPESITGPIKDFFGIGGGAAAAAEDIAAGEAVGDIGSTMPVVTPAEDIAAGEAVGDIGSTMPVTPYEPLSNAAIEDIAANAIASQGLAYPGGAAELAVHANSLGAADVAAAEAAGGEAFASMAASYGPYIAAAIILDQMTGGAIGDAVGDVVTGVGDLAGDVVSGVGDAAEDVVSGFGNAVSSFFGGFGWADGGQVNGLSMSPTIQTSNALGTMLDNDLMSAYERATQSGDAAKARAYKTEIDYRSRNPSRMATGGISDAHYNLGGYSDGGRLLKGPGDGVSDDIPATIGRNKQPARLADGEFVVPARIVSELGNGSTEAGARKLYAMMDRIQAARSKTVGKGKVAKNTRADKHLPA